jgi:hypothetical protein
LSSESLKLRFNGQDSNTFLTYIQPRFLWKNWRTFFPVSFLHEEWQELTEWQIFGIITLHHGESQTQAQVPLTVDHPNPSDNFHT